MGSQQHKLNTISNSCDQIKSTKNIIINKPTQQNHLVSQSLKLAEYYLADIDLDQFSRSIFIRLFIQKDKQGHILKILDDMNHQKQQSNNNKNNKSMVKKQLKSNKMKNVIYSRKQLSPECQDLLFQISKAEIQILDCLYQNLVVKQQPPKSNGRPRGFNICQEVTPSSYCSIDIFDRNITSINNLQRDNYQNKCGIQLVDLSDENSPMLQNQSQIYQEYKQIGFKLLQKSKVGFVLLAGGRNIRYGISGKKIYKQCEKIPQLPSESNLIEILFKRLQALGSLTQSQITLFILISQKKKKRQYQKIQHKTMKGKQSMLRIMYMDQVQYGCLDQNGGLVLDDHKHIFMHPNGNGDFWGFFENSGLIRKQMLNYQYLQVFGVSNILEHCFDCFMIGKAKKDNHSWVTLASQANSGSDTCPFIYINQKNQLQTCSSDQPNCPQSIEHIYLNNSVISTNFISQIFKDSNPHQLQKFRVKRKFINNQAPLSNYRNIYVFQRQFSQIFKLVTYSTISQRLLTSSSDNNNSNNNRTIPSKFNCKQYLHRPSDKPGCIILMNKQDYYSPLIYQKDLDSTAYKLSQKYKRWLHLQFLQKQKIIQIDPLLSLEGQNLQQCLFEQAQLQFINFPMYLSTDNIITNTTTDDIDQLNNNNNNTKKIHRQVL